MSTKHILTLAIDDACDIPTEQLAQMLHRLIPGSHALSDTEVIADLTDFEWDNDDGPVLPMSAEEATSFMDKDGFLTVVTTINQDIYFEHAAYMNTYGADTHEDLTHRTIFTFGMPCDCSTEVIGLAEDNFIVSYTTNIAEVL